MLFVWLLFYSNIHSVTCQQLLLKLCCNFCNLILILVINIVELGKIKENNYIGDDPNEHRKKIKNITD